MCAWAAPIVKDFEGFFNFQKFDISFNWIVPLRCIIYLIGATAAVQGGFSGKIAKKITEKNPVRFSPTSARVGERQVD